MSKSKSSKKSKKGGDESDDFEEDDGEDNLDDELQHLNKKDIITTGRRTRGKKIDYTQFGN